MSRHYFYNKINKCYLKVITCNSPCHHPLVFFFRISINCPGARLSCSEPEAAYADVTWAISEKKKNILKNLFCGLKNLFSGFLAQFQGKGAHI